MKNAAKASDEGKVRGMDTPGCSGSETNGPEKKKRGRPRCFDPEAALDRAMILFWERGYDATAMDDLATAMGLSPSSIYATYGDKQALYQAAIDRYLKGPGAYTLEIMRSAPSAKEAMSQILQAAAGELTRADRPAGCMLASAVTHCAPQAEKLQAAMAQRRQESMAQYVSLFSRALTEGELPLATNITGLARYYASVLQGMTLQARDGAKPAELKAIAETAMRAWPA